MSEKVLYFIAGDAPTSAELAEITTLNTIASKPYDVQVVCGKPKAKLTAITLSAASGDNSYNDAGSTITASTISAAAADNSYNDSGNGFLTAGFQVGDIVTVTGFTGDTANNITNGHVTAVTAAKMTIGGADGDVIVNDSAGESVTIACTGRFLRCGFAVGDTVDVKGFTGNAANNIDSGVITALTATKMTIGGTDGDVIVTDAAGESVTIETRVPKTAAYGTGVLLEADYYAGTVPATYKTAGTENETVLSVTAPPVPSTMIATQTVVTTAQEIAITSGSGNTKVTLTVAGNAITACVLS